MLRIPDGIYLEVELEDRKVHVFTSNDYEGELIECDEGDLKWIDKEEVTKLNTWEGDKIFVEKLQHDNTFFTVKFEYNREKLIKYDLKIFCTNLKIKFAKYMGIYQKWKKCILL